jgi:hypothetical protein
MVLCMGRHELARERRRPSDVLSSVLAPAATFVGAGRRRKFTLTAVTACTALAVVGAIQLPQPTAADTQAIPVVEEAAPFAIEIVPAPVAPPVPSDDQANPADAVRSVASRYRIVDRALPAGVAPEKGLQIKTILAARAISAIFPEIHEIGGMRPDALRWHPDGLALDVMIPNPSSPEGIALGNDIVRYALENAQRFDLQDCIWRGVYYTPGGAQSGRGYGHFDHVHVTTHGGGYPPNGETYYR